MEKQVNVKMVLGIMCTVMIIMLSVAFAHFSRMLKTAGQGKVDPANFDIHFKNLSEPVLHGGAEVTGTPTIASEGANINNIAVTLKLPGDYVSYTVDIENTGDINVEVSNIEHTDLDNSLLELEVYYTDTEERLQTGDELQPSEVKNITVKIKYKDIENPDLLPDTVQTINFSYSVTYTQSNNEALYSSDGFPKNYTRLEYLESTGTQYINTKYITNSKTKMYVDFKITDLVSIRNWVAGSNDHNNNARFAFGVNISGTSSTWQYNICNISPTSGGTNTNRNTIEYDAYIQRIRLNGNNVSVSPTWNNLDNNILPILIFASSNSNGTTSNSYSRIYSVMIYENNALIANFIPALDLNGKPCMYDTVSKQPFYNQGTGEFLYGYDYSNEETYASGLPKSFTELEYLESTGTQYIDTNITGTRTNMAYEIQFERNSTTTWLFGNVTGVGNSNDSGVTIGSIRFGTKYITDINLSSGIQEVYVDKNKYIINGMETQWSSTATASGNKNIYLFWANGSSAGKGGKIYSFKIFNNSNLILSFIPALDRNGIPCMYDTVSKHPFYNDGTGEFVYGLKE